MSRRRIRSAKITHVSLCRAGKNRLPTILKSKDGGQDSVRFESLFKMADNFDVKGELLAVVYAPEHRDTDGDIADADAIKEAAYSFAKSGKGIDIEHDQKVLPRDAAYVAESFLIAKGDERFSDWKDSDGNTVDVTGGWGMVVKIEDPDLRELYKSGEWNGVSMFGTAQVETEKSDDVDAFLRRFMERLKMTARVSVYGDSEMTPEEFKTMFKSEMGSMADAIATAVAKALKPAEPVAPTASVTQPTTDPKPSQADRVKQMFGIEAPVFKGDISKSEDMLAHATALKRYQRLLSLNLDDPKELEDFAKSVKEETPATPTKPTSSPTSNVPDPTPTSKSAAPKIEGVSEEDMVKSMESAKAIAAYANQRLGGGARADRMA